MSQKPSLPKGTRDFGPQQMAKRNYILSTIKGVFETYGFMPLETPAMENLSVLTGKYGDEGDQLLFKILNSGDFAKDVKSELPKAYQAKDTFEDIFLSIYKATQKGQLNAQATEREFIYSAKKSLSNSIGIEPNLHNRILEYFELNSANLTESFLSFYEQVAYTTAPETDHFRQFVSEEVNKKILPDFETFLNSKKQLPKISSKGLKYDLTVPFARYVVMNMGDIALPFKRYQIQPVWRADRPQKGRYREFFQCDADVIGTDSLVCEAEIIMMMNDVLSQLKIEDYTIKVNNRKILSGITEAIGAPGKENDFCVAIDKLDKIGQEKVLEELKERGLSEEAIKSVKPILNVTGDSQEKINYLKGILAENELGLEGLQEIEDMFSLVESMDGSLDRVDFDVTLARGLSYYTGAIFEIQVNNVKIGSVSGGGRYDDLTGVFGMPDMSGVGFSFGVDRIYDVMEELSLFPTASLTSTQALIIHFDESSFNYGLGVLSQLRKEDIKSEIYPEKAKLKKQFTYADKKGIPFTIIIGEEEMAKNQLTLRNMSSGEEEKLPVEKITQLLG